MALRLYLDNPIPHAIQQSGRRHLANDAPVEALGPRQVETLNRLTGHNVPGLPGPTSGVPGHSAFLDYF